MNTRISITCNGPIHIGHLGMCLINEQVAHNSGGKFHVRWDDGQPYWIKKVGVEKQREFAEQARQDIEWIGIPVDSWVSENDDALAWTATSFVDRCLLLLNACDYALDGDPSHDYGLAKYRSISSVDTQYYPLVPRLTLEKVWWDHFQEITHVIRGEELASEASLYAFLFHWAGLAIPEQIFVPRLRHKNGEDLSDVSKTKGNLRVDYFRRLGYLPQDVRRILAQSYLKIPGMFWTLDNLKPNPTLELNP